MHVNMRVEVDEVAEGLNEEDDARPRTGPCAGVEASEQALDDMAQLAQQRAPAREERPQQARHGEHVLPVRHRGEHVCVHPFAVGEHSLLVAARAEVPRLAIYFDATPEPATRLQFMRMQARLHASNNACGPRESVRRI